MAKYVLLTGKHSAMVGGARVLHAPGDIIDLEPQQAEAFKDKVKLYSSVLAETAAVKAAEDLKAKMLDEKMSALNAAQAIIKAEEAKAVVAAQEALAAQAEAASGTATKEAEVAKAAVTTDAKAKATATK